MEGKAHDYLSDRGIPFSYETETFTYVKQHTYRPDFILPKKDGTSMYIEFKGRFTSSDRAKMLLVKEFNPDKDIRLVFQQNNYLYKSSKTTYTMWADKAGFQYYLLKDKTKFNLPTEWLKELKK